MDAPITIGGESLTQSRWAKKLGVTRGAIYFRKMKYGETSEQAVLHFYNRKRWRNLDRFATAPDAEAAFANFCLKNRDGVCKPWACPLQRNTGATSCFAAWLFATAETKGDNDGK